MTAPVAKTVEAYTAQRVTISSKKLIKDVLAALDAEGNKDQGGSIVTMLANAKSKEDIVSGTNKLTDNGKRDFVIFSVGSHTRWVSTYCEGRKFPETYFYIIGNPLVAQGILQHDLTVGLHIPPKLLVVEAEGGKGTDIIYDLPSSVIVVAKNADPEMRKAAEELDEKFENMVRRVLG